LGTSFWPAGPFGHRQAAGSNPFAISNGLNRAMAGFPVFWVGMFCPVI
jgi:hypothetical protein